VVPGLLRSTTVTSWRWSRSFAKIAKYIPDGPPPTQVSVTVTLSWSQNGAEI